MVHDNSDRPGRIVRDDRGRLWQRRGGDARWAFALAGVLLAVPVVGQLTSIRGTVESDLEQRALAVLQQAGYQRLTVSASGRDLTISGPADPAAVSQILSLVSAQEGVRVARLSGTAGTASGAGAPTSSPSATAAPTESPTQSAPTTTPTVTDSASLSASTGTATGPTATTTPAPTPAPAPAPTAAGTSAEAAGQEIGELPKIDFPTALSGPTANGRATVSKIAAILKRYPDTRVRVEGHTDDLGSGRVNLELSASRAEVVRTLLIRAGISAARLTAKGYGESRPLVPNTSAANRATNRRVAFTVS